MLPDLHMYVINSGQKSTFSLRVSNWELIMRVYFAPTFFFFALMFSASCLLSVRFFCICHFSSCSSWRGWSVICAASIIFLSTLMWRCWTSRFLQRPWTRTGRWALFTSNLICAAPEPKLKLAHELNPTVWISFFGQLNPDLMISTH